MCNEDLHKEMSLHYDKAAMGKWADSAMLEDITYHRKRQQLWDKFVQVLKEGKEGTKTLDRKLFSSIKGALCCRSEEMNDTKKLAFETALSEIFEAVEEDDDDDAAFEEDPSSKEKKEKKPKGDVELYSPSKP